jgi:hypothetical protein
MRDQEVPDHGLEGFRVRSDAGRIDHRNEDTGVRNLGSVASIASDDAADRCPNLESVFKGTDQVCADVLSGIAAADGENEYHVVLIQPGTAKPIGVTRIPALVVHASREFRDVVGRSVSLDMRDFSKITHGMGSMSGAATYTKEEEPS